VVITYNPDRADVLNNDYVSGKKTVTHLTQVLVAAGSANLDKRQLIYLENVGNKDCFFGPSGVSTTGATQGGRLCPGQWYWLSLGPNQDMYVICRSGESTEIVIQEWA